jgi:negative regulator of flagellin synthesis FlgM
MSAVNLTGKPGGISDAEQTKINRASETARIAESSGATPTVGGAAAEGDVIRVSDEAAAINKLAEQAAQAPEIRQEKVAKLREQLQSGAYRPTADDIADAIIRDETT